MNRNDTASVRPGADKAEPIRRVLLSMGTRASFVRLVATTVLIVLLFGILEPSVFLSASNLQFLALSTPELALLSLAIALTMLTGGIDLSVVAVANLAGITGALVMTGHEGSVGRVSAGCLVALMTAGLCGLINGWVVSTLRVTPILATLGSSQLFAGIGLGISGGTVVKGLPAAFSAFATTTVAGVPLIFIVMLMIAGLTACLAARTRAGFRMRLLGANPSAARLSGFRNGRVLVLTYVCSSLIAGVAGVIISSRASGADSDYGNSYVLLGIVVAVLAGVRPEGGYLTVAGVVIAALAMQMLSTGLLGMQVDSHVVNIAQGGLLIGMMALNHYADLLRQTLARVRARRPRSQQVQW